MMDQVPSRFSAFLSPSWVWADAASVRETARTARACRFIANLLGWEGNHPAKDTRRWTAWHPAVAHSVGGLDRVDLVGRRRGLAVGVEQAAADAQELAVLNIFQLLRLGHQGD